MVSCGKVSTNRYVSTFFKAIIRFKHFLAIRRHGDKALLPWSRQAVVH